MRLVVFSDSHKRESAVLDIIERHKDNADLFIFLGDGNDDVDTALMIYKDINIERVCGNCDFGSIYPTHKILEIDGKRILISHGHTYYVKHGYNMIMQEAKNNKIDICLFGHTHIPYVEYIDGINYMNPGSARDGSYGIADITEKGIMLYTNRI